MTVDDFAAMGVKTFHRRLILRTIDRLSHEANAIPNPIQGGPISIKSDTGAVAGL